MKQLINFVLLVAGCFLASTSFAQPAWRCRAQDRFRNWLSTRHFVRQNAINQAYRRCRNLSRRPRTCRVAPSWCWRVGRGFAPPPPARGWRRWRCISADLRGARFRGGSRNRWDAERRAMRNCRRENPYWRSCSLIVCRSHSF